MSLAGGIKVILFNLFIVCGIVHTCIRILLGCGGGCIAGSTVGAVFATGITVTVIVLIIILRKKKLSPGTGMSICIAHIITFIRSRKNKLNTGMSK